MKNSIILLISILFLSGCAIPKGSQSSNYSDPMIYHPHSIRRPYHRSDSQLSTGIYHEIKKGQTLWRIAREYNIPLNELVRANNIKDYTNLKQGQLLFIPNAAKKIDVSTRFSNRKILVDTEKKFISPLKGKITVGFGEKKDHVANKGIDISAPYGAQVAASKSGVVSYQDDNMRGLGRVVIIDHQDGYISVYAHLSECLVQTKESVRQGQKIGYVGKSGKTNSSGLHFEIRKNAKPVDPRALISV